MKEESKIYPDYDFMHYQFKEEEKTVDKYVFSTYLRIRKKKNKKWFLVPVIMHYDGKDSEQFMKQVHATVYKMIKLYIVPKNSELKCSPTGSIGIIVDKNQESEKKRLKSKIKI